MNSSSPLPKTTTRKPNPPSGKPTIFSLNDIFSRAESLKNIGSKLYFTLINDKTLSYQIPGDKASSLTGRFSSTRTGIEHKNQVKLQEIGAPFDKGSLLKDRILDGANPLNINKKIFTIQSIEDSSPKSSSSSKSSSSPKSSSSRGGKRKRNKSRKVRKIKSRRNISKKYFFW